jgi:hypothetical protein
MMMMMMMGGGCGAYSTPVFALRTDGRYPASPPFYLSLYAAPMAAFVIGRRLRGGRRVLGTEWAGHSSILSLYVRTAGGCHGKKDE